MARIEFYDGTSALAHEAQVSASNNQLIVYANGQHLSFAARDVTPTLSTPNGRRFIHLPNNMTLEFHDNADAEQLLDDLNASHLRKVRWFDRHYRSWSFIGGALIVFIGLVTAMYVFLLPVVSNQIAASLPNDLLDSVSEKQLNALVESKYLLPSQLSKERQAQLRTQFEALKKPDTHVPFKLHFYSAPSIGPNAFALPSGDVVLLDELVNITTTDQQTMGVLAHELGHVAHRHALRGIIQDSIVSFAVAAWLGDYGSTIANMGASTLFTQKYSRDFEREADEYAINTMKLNHISPSVLADFFVIMEKNETNKAKHTHEEGKNNITLIDLIQSHPPTDERIDTLRKASEQ